VVQFDPHPLESLDEFLSGLLPSLPVDIISGPNDPTTHLMPQKPIHPSLVRESSHYSTFNSLPNPSLFEENNTVCLGTGGQVVDDLFKYVYSESRIGTKVI
jgi:DNA polymerase delta subunit 2